MDLETKVCELYLQVQKLQEYVDEMKRRSNSDDTENLIAEEVHWFYKIFRKIFCYR